MCNVNKCVEKELSLVLTVQKSEIKEMPLNGGRLKKTLLRLNWPNLVQSAKAMGENSLPTEIKPELLQNKEFMEKMHNILFQFHVLEGSLACPECNRIYYIKNGIPNLLLDETEI